jgi:hypothetical protein
MAGGVPASEFKHRPKRGHASHPESRSIFYGISYPQQRKYLMSKGEPPSASGRSSAPFLIGENSRGNWVVQDPGGLRGGLFVDRTQALKYAMSENGSHPQAVIMVPDGLELDMSAKPCASEHRAEDVHATLKRVA